MKKDDDNNKSNALAISIALGLLIGTIIGYSTSNIKLWIPIGTSIGLMIGSIFN